MIEKNISRGQADSLLAAGQLNEVKETPKKEVKKTFFKKDKK